MGLYELKLRLKKKLGLPLELNAIRLHIYHYQEKIRAIDELITGYNEAYAPIAAQHASSDGISCYLPCVPVGTDLLRARQQNLTERITWLEQQLQ